MPSVLYRLQLGWLLGQRFVELTIRGRKSGLWRRVVLEVVGPHEATGDLLVASAWGPRSQWFRNLQAFPRARVRVGRRRFEADVVPLDEDAAAAALAAYARAHRLAYRWAIGPLLLGRRPVGTPDEFAGLARSVPILVIRPAA